MKGQRFRSGLLQCVEFVFTLLLVVVVSTSASAITATPRVIFMIPAQSRSSHQLNERNTLTNKLESGWIMKADQEAEYLIYVLIDEDIHDMSEIKASFVHFTTSSSQCVTPSEKENMDELMTRTFPLKFLKGKSKVHHNNTSSLSSRLTKRFVNDKSISENSQNSTLLVGKVQVTLAHTTSKYYLCFYFAKQQSADDNDEEEFSDEMEYLRQRVNYDSFVHQGESNPFIQIITTKDLLPIYLVVIFYFMLLCFSALFSGLNLGLMSLDLTELSILKKCGTKKEKVYAAKIYPLRRKGNLLLCTILIGNVLVNSTSTLILGSYLEGIFAAIGSTMLIVIFGEIIPQAVCSRHGLAVGAFTRYITYTMLGVTFVVSYPLSLVLDFFLGKEIASSFSRDKVRELMRQAVTRGGHSSGLEHKQFKLISGALDFKHKRVKEIMVPIKEVFSLDINSILDFDTFKTILFHGYSRIPVYEHTKENLVGMILIQDLLLNDPADRVPLRVVMDYYKHKVPKCHLESRLESMFDLFRKGDSHMAFVYKTKGETTNTIKNDDDDQDEHHNDQDSSRQKMLTLSTDSNNNHQIVSSSSLNNSIANLDDSNLLNEAVGILTLEDIIEELVQSEIMDEADTKREKRRKRAREFLKGKLKSSASLSNENLNIFVTEADQTNKPLISTQIRRALYYFLAFCVRPFSEEFVSPKLLEAFLKQPELVIEKRNLSGYESDTSMLLYQYGVESDYFIIILDGNAMLEVGGDGGAIEINAGLFSYYGVHALVDDSVHDAKQILSQLTAAAVTDSSSDLSGPTSAICSTKPYKPEFNLRVDSYCVYMKITRAEWLDVVKKSELLKVVVK